MKFTIKTILLAATTSLLAATPISKKEDTIARQNNQFAFDLYKEIIQDKDQNVFFSPFSISTALAMTYAGANSETAREMADAMHFGENSPEFHYAYKDYLEQLISNAKGNIELNIANRLWGEKSYTLNKDFIQINDLAYGSPLSHVNFKKQPNESRISINKWVERQTKDKIKDLLAPGVVTPDTRLVLTNAIYFKADWLHAFSKENTRQRPFHYADESKKNTDFMHQQRIISYVETSKYKTVRLPYNGDKQSLIVVLPRKSSTLAKTEASLNQSVIDEIFKAKPTLVDLALPKFRIIEPLGLNSYLKRLGMKQAFDTSADFSNMTPKNDLYISDGIHKAFIEIDETGTEAAAATAVVMTIESTSVEPIPVPKQFIADHPFVFFIVDNETKAVLFMGKILDPISK
jgi:serpin B